MTELSGIIGNSNIEELLQRINEGYDVNVQDGLGLTPLMHAIKSNIQNKSQVVEVLIEGGANIHAKDKQGKSVLDYAISISNYKIVRKLIGMNIENFGKALFLPIHTEQDMMVSSASVFAPILINSMKNKCLYSDKTLEYLSSQYFQGMREKVLPYVLNKALLDIFSDDIKSSNSTKNKAIKYIMDMSTKHNITLSLWHDKLGATALHYAARIGNKDTISQVLTIAKNRDIEKKDIDGQTPLAYAAKSGNTITIEKLITAAGANTKVKDNNRKTLEQIASENNQQTALNLINQWNQKEQSVNIHYQRSQQFYTTNKILLDPKANPHNVKYEGQHFYQKNNESSNIKQNTNASYADMKTDSMKNQNKVHTSSHSYNPHNNLNSKKVALPTFNIDSNVNLKKAHSEVELPKFHIDNDTNTKDTNINAELPKIPKIESTFPNKIVSTEQNSKKVELPKFSNKVTETEQNKQFFNKISKIFKNTVVHTKADSSATNPLHNFSNKSVKKPLHK
ncbi:ankyrin repeat domain-containing protein [Rickettsia endosymbiont of Cardiosporidium cionae]|uniref:ankyrin repeat domain-containing protein n=1 Tax=Rickettsia endosymbiont of Cardiosporidium cionae TaxID=2777155 RepID=UPI001894630F|nr:ankyrin repeat domain-containing protein [Rickettsia endosymbiont of Cardiosporidium cionae]KAF8818435.1 hypothetical protein IHI24_000525 [Rickettsia endosymbiont of Cardiosporidium cionae]